MTNVLIRIVAYIPVMLGQAKAFGKAPRYSKKGVYMSRLLPPG